MFEAVYPPMKDGQRGKREPEPEYVVDKVASFPEAFVERYSIG